MQDADRLKGCRVLVAGDVIVDRYQFGRPSRISREAPIVILESSGEAANPGGAANAAANVRSLGGITRLLGVVGDDSEGDMLLQQLRRLGIPNEDMVVEKARRTTTKTRVFAGTLARGQQVVRLDRAHDASPRPPTRRQLIDRALALTGAVDAVLLSDYGYGALDPGVSRKIIAEARRRHLPVIVDSQGNLARYRGASLLTPNQAELESWTGRRLDSAAAVESAARRLLRSAVATAVLCTRGAEGMCLVDKAHAWHMPVARRVEVFDVAGAGDTVAATMALAAAASLPTRIAAVLAACAASVVVRKHGAATCSPGELRAAIRATDRAALQAVGLTVSK